LGKELLIDAAHALRSPLSSIKGYSNTLLQVDVTWTPAEYREFLKTTDREADELNRAIDDLVHATGEELGTVNLNLEQATVESLFQIVEADLADESGQCQARFKCEQGLPPVLVD
jgi:K+-sensing histidine kinase KdpD